VIPTPDQFDILRVMGNDHPRLTNYPRPTKRIINRLTVWHKRYGIVIAGADYDWVDIRFLSDPLPAAASRREVRTTEPSRPKRVRQAFEGADPFALEVARLCPDHLEGTFYFAAEKALVEEGGDLTERAIYARALEMIVADIVRTKRLYLWWD
jgi:hypothetical protein